jgi:hypothetical protein
VKFGNPILTSELSGSLGGVVASSARGGVGYFRVRARPGQPQTLAQTIVRSIITSLASAWRTVLTSLQRADWESIAGSTASGINAYAKGNDQRLLAGIARVDDAPDSASLSNLPITTLPVVDASAHTITSAVPAGETLTTVNYNVYLSAPQSASRASQQFPFQFAGYSTPLSAGDPISIAVPVGHPGYNLTAGQVVYVRIVGFGNETADEGKVGTDQTFRCIVVA